VRGFRKVHLRYEGTDSPLVVNFDAASMKEQFEQAHPAQRYGFIVGRRLIVEAVSVEVVED